MKKIIVFILVVITIIGGYYFYRKSTLYENSSSEKVTNNKSKLANSSSVCSVLDNIQGSTPLLRGRWLRNNITTFDDSFYKCVADRHEIEKDFFYDSVEADWNEQSFWDVINPFFKKYTDVSFAEIEKINNCGCYNVFISLSTTKLNKIEPNSVIDFSNDITCYTLPLFRGVRLANGLTNNDKIEFVHTKYLNESNVFKKGIFFRVYNKNTNTYHFYNISDDPGRGFF